MADSEFRDDRPDDSGEWVSPSETRYPTAPYPTDTYAAAQEPTSPPDPAWQHPVGQTPTEQPSAGGVRNRSTDPVALIAGLLTVALAVYLVVGGSWNLQWLLALGAVGVGIVMLVASVRPRRHE